MTKFYFKKTAPALRSFAKVLGPEFSNFSDGGRFNINMARCLGYESYISRQGEWSDPFETEVEPIHTMPTYDPNFNFSFNEVSDLRALEIKKLINTTDRPVMVSWSGGLDSTVSVVALLKNLTSEELSKLTISMSSDSIVENPQFYYDHIHGKVNVADSTLNLFSDYKEQKNAFCISSDTGDAIFGTELGTKLYAQLHNISKSLTGVLHDDINKLYLNISSEDVHYSKYRDFIVFYLNQMLKNNVTSTSALSGLDYIHNNLKVYSKTDEMFGDLFYEKLVKNIKTSPVPIHSLHDFFWWSIFNLKYMHCALRAPLLYSVGTNRETLIKDCVIQWYGSTEYQQWSMVNNNNGQKIQGPTQGAYKYAARKYIYEFDNNEWYFTHKIKIASLPSIIIRNWRKNYNSFDSMLGIDINYDAVHLGTPEVDNMVIELLSNSKIDWA
jgi:hypothetical protein